MSSDSSSPSQPTASVSKTAPGRVAEDGPVDGYVMVKVDKHLSISSHFKSEVFAVLYNGTLLLCNGAINRSLVLLSIPLVDSRLKMGKQPQEVSSSTPWSGILTLSPAFKHLNKGHSLDSTIFIAPLLDISFTSLHLAEATISVVSSCQATALLAEFGHKVKYVQAPKKRYFVANALGISWHKAGKTQSTSHDGSCGLQPSLGMQQSGVLEIDSGLPSHPLALKMPLLTMVFDDIKKRQEWLKTTKDCIFLWMELELAFLCRAQRTGDFLCIATETLQSIPPFALDYASVEGSEARMKCLQDLRSASVAQQQQAAAAVVLQTEKLSVVAGGVAHRHSTSASDGSSLSFVASTSSSAAAAAAAGGGAAAAAAPIESDGFTFSVAHPEDEKLVKKPEHLDPSAALYRSQLPNTADDDDVHIEGVIFAELGHQKGAHSIHEYFFSLRTARCTGRRVVLWRKRQSGHVTWEGHVDLLLSEVSFPKRLRKAVGAVHSDYGIKVLDEAALPKAKVVFAFTEEKVFWQWLWALTMQPLPVWMLSQVPSSSSSSSSSSSTLSSLQTPAPVCGRCMCCVSPAYLYLSQHSSLHMTIEQEEGASWVSRFLILFQGMLAVYASSSSAIIAPADPVIIVTVTTSIDGNSMSLYDCNTSKRTRQDRPNTLSIRPVDSTKKDHGFNNTKMNIAFASIDDLVMFQEAWCDETETAHTHNLRSNDDGVHGSITWNRMCQMAEIAELQRREELHSLKPASTPLRVHRSPNVKVDIFSRTNTEDFNPVDADLNSSSSSSSSSSTLRSMDNHDGGESVRRVSIHSESHSVEATVVLSAAVVADIQFVSVGRIEVKDTKMGNGKSHPKLIKVSKEDVVLSVLRSDRSGSKLQKQSVPLLIDFKPGQNRKILQVESGASCLPSSWGRRATASTVCLSVEGAKGGEVEHVAFESDVHERWVNGIKGIQSLKEEV